jgi:integrase
MHLFSNQKVGYRGVLKPPRSSVPLLYNALNQMSARSFGQGKHADGQGLWLIKRDKVLGKWILRLVVHGKRREMGLGSWPDVSIAEARERAAAARKQLRDGVDPIFERQKVKRRVKPLTLSEAINSCFEAKKAELKRDGDAGKWLQPLSVHIIPKIGKHPVEEINQHVLLDVLQPIWHERSEMARKALNRVNLTLKHAAALGLDVDLQATMKVRALLGKQRHTVKHIPSLPYKDAPAFYQWLKTQSGVSALALRFLILTVARTSEVRFATFDEIKGDVWVLAPERTKSDREHKVPLTNEALEVIAEARVLSPNEYLFPSVKGKPLSDAAMALLMKREGYSARPHGFRSTFRTWAEEQTDAPFEVKESILGHLVDAGVVGAYQRSDRIEARKILLGKWTSALAG